MIVLAGALGGALWGGLRARARGGAPADIAQYAAAHGIAGAILGLFASIGLDLLL